MLPPVSKEEIRRAIAEFDVGLRSAVEWKGWEQKGNQRWALEDSGRLYPPKKIVSLATGRPVSTFSGGQMTNSYLDDLGFKVIKLPGAIAASGEIPVFVVGNAYRRKDEITGRFGGSGQSGIAPSSIAPAIFLFSGGSGEQYGYKDHLDETGCLLYTGEGQVGDMTMTRGNAAIAMHAKSGRALHMFENTGKGKSCVYKGEFVYGSHFTVRGPDRNGDDRELIVFRLIPVSKISEMALELDGRDADQALQEPTTVGAVELRQLRDAAVAACQSPTSSTDPKQTLSVIYRRSLQVRRYVLARARGHCELCYEPAPFYRKSDGSPYLEPHHINRLSDGGLDHPLYVGAICPACHRRIHFGVDGAAQNEQLRANVEEREAEVARNEDL